MKQEDRDTVTVAEIREFLNERLENDLVLLCAYIRKGYHTMHESEDFMTKAIKPTLTQLDNVNAWAGTALMRRIGPKSR